MEERHRQGSHKTIIRLAEVLRRTGFSRSTVYTRIAKGEFPRQISLGARSVGWDEEEVDGWIRKRLLMRPASESNKWLQNEDPIDVTTTVTSLRERSLRQMSAKESAQSQRSKSRGIGSVPDLAQLELIGINVYVDKTTGTLWFQVLHPKQFED